LNTAVGLQALQSNLTGSANTAVGVDALLSCNSSNNTAMGYYALYSDTSGYSNTAVGYLSLFANTMGSYNTATGPYALYSNTTGTANTANGFGALSDNNTGGYNMASGFESLQFNTTGNNNVATGVYALSANTSGHDNTATGFQALAGNSIGSNNIAVGSNAGIKLTKENNNIDIGNAGVAGESKVIRIGTKGTQLQTFIAGISGVAATGSNVVVNAMGKLGVTTSSARFKEAIKPMDTDSEAILALKPVSFRYKEEIDPDRIAQFGLIAEEVEKVDPRLVGRDDQGKVNTVRYEAVNAMLLNEFLKEHHKAQQQDADINELKSIAARQNAMIVKQQRQIDAFAADLQKANTRSELRKARGNVAANE
jgi:hypothetical protein